MSVIISTQKIYPRIGSGPTYNNKPSARNNYKKWHPELKIFFDTIAQNLSNQGILTPETFKAICDRLTKKSDTLGTGLQSLKIIDAFRRSVSTLRNDKHTMSDTTGGMIVYSLVDDENKPRGCVNLKNNLTNLMLEEHIKTFKLDDYRVSIQTWEDNTSEATTSTASSSTSTSSSQNLPSLYINENKIDSQTGNDIEFKILLSVLDNAAQTHLDLSSVPIPMLQLLIDDATSVDERTVKKMKDTLLSVYDILKKTTTYNPEDTLYAFTYGDTNPRTLLNADSELTNPAIKDLIRAEIASIRSMELVVPPPPRPILRPQGNQQQAPAVTTTRAKPASNKRSSSKISKDEGDENSESIEARALKVRKTDRVTRSQTQSTSNTNPPSSSNASPVSEEIARLLLELRKGKK
ncbi:MAG: hypothetical protein P4L16_06655 [Chlamydiales bacterium]|nr:hypothetical protein [Chlamydiales bacterium]